VSQTLVVYTAIFGDIPDRLQAPRTQRPDPTVRYVCFTDCPESFRRVAPWEIRAAAWTDADSRRTARFHKVLSHRVVPDAGYSLWLDGNLGLEVDPWTIVRCHLSSGIDIATFKHAHRNCVYQELETCLRLDKDDAGAMRAQVERYRIEGYPRYNGLAETTAFARREGPAIREFNEAWWREIERGSARDQLSFDYVAWKLSLDYGWLPGVREDCPYFRFSRHR
jgi:hypothetical protein